MNESHHLGELQYAIMRVLWERGEATVAQVQSALAELRDPASTTVATVLGRMEKRGLVAHRTEGRQYVYEARVTEQDVRRSMVDDLTGLLFAGDPTALVSHLLGAPDLTPGDLDRVKEAIDAKVRELQSSPRKGGDSHDA